MANLRESESAAIRTHEDANAQLDAIPSDLLTSPEPSDMANAAAKLRAAIAPSRDSHGSSAEAHLQPPSSLQQGPRLERVPTLRVNSRAIMTP